MRFALLGASGYVAPRHFKAIKETGNELVAALDPHDAAGALDRYFPDCLFFLDEAEFFRWLVERRDVPWVSVCTPSHLHLGHCIAALNTCVSVICEKPVVHRLSHLDRLEKLQKLTGERVCPLLQLRHHPIMARMRAKVRELRAAETAVDIQVRYHVYRGEWYDKSWKGSPDRGGGPLRDLGVHLFDALIGLMGYPNTSYMNHRSFSGASGGMCWHAGEATWDLSRRSRIPRREFEINGEVFDCSTGFEDLHTRAYEEILAGNGPDLGDARKAIALIEELR